MENLPESCQHCHQGTYWIDEFLEDKAAQYLESIGVESIPGRTFRDWCIQAPFYAKIYGEDIEQFYEIRYYDCPHKNDCNLGKIL